jgi:hypothetical protein
MELTENKSVYGFIVMEGAGRILGFGGSTTLYEAARVVANASVDGGTCRVDLYDSQGRYALSIVSAGPAAVRYVNMLDRGSLRDVQ